MQRKKGETEYERITKSASFAELMKKKKAFLVPSILFFMVFYFSLPVLAVYTTVLETPVIGEITWAWVLAIAQFIMTWTFCILYVKKSARFDKLAEKVVSEQDTDRKEGAGL
ncbi:hypothetical protein CHH78_05745 [Shouchella clausii]|uniref:DUF485 domain-containing protein n=1 Tax=Shouchella clausii TaxID=79880 RepID=UPI000BA783C6|nr:DUF485 domain-containing protein [Shouchella clausii]MBU8594579.1 DUF485 domain-containing protein [Shouchella clausii]MCY1104690.1 DUF485 domain-containing protein [Shouchella clausii]PAD11269.1 hypothetical protein CHH76_00360 [Shouchella clausii]PAD91808.1 hypothetical protein CHH52_13170 [Shouchella clausii]PAE85063.1 hypothetical protein CHH78_05745 [Shouchella clausii]